MRRRNRVRELPEMEARAIMAEENAAHFRRKGLEDFRRAESLAADLAREREELRTITTDRDWAISRLALREPAEQAERVANDYLQALGLLASIGEGCWHHTATSHQPRLRHALDKARAVLGRAGAGKEPFRLPGCPGPDHYGDHSGVGGCGGFGPECGSPSREGANDDRG